MNTRRRNAEVAALLLCLALSGCGYHSKCVVTVKTKVTCTKVAGDPFSPCEFSQLDNTCTDNQPVKVPGTTTPGAPSPAPTTQGKKTK